MSEAKPGDLLFYGNEHCAIYLGTADLVDSFTGEVLEPNAIFLAHCGTDRGVEITTNSELENSGLQLTTVYSLEWTEDIAYFIPSSPDPSDRANTVVMAKRHFFSLGGDVDYKYYVWKGYMHRVGSGRWCVNECAYFELANGAIAYCLEPWVTSGAAGQSYEEIPDPWNPDRYNDSSVGDQAAILGPDARKKQAIQKILACGVHNTSQNATEAEKRATALFIWDAVCGYWDGNIANQSTKETGQYDDYGASIDNPPFYRSTWGYDNGVKAAYEAISNRIKGGQKYPSFANLSSSSLGAANTFTLVKNPSNGMYEASKTDTNNILGDYNFTISPISGLTISRSGNVLKISATEAAASEVYRRKGVVASATGHFYNFGGQNMNMTVWGDIWDSSVQKFISLVNFSMKPLPCYIKIDAKVDLAAPVSLKKSMKGDPDIIAQLQGNACYSLAGAEYGVYKGGTWQETIKTNANGDATSAKKYENGTVLTIKELKAPPGSSWIKTPTPSPSEADKPMWYMWLTNRHLTRTYYSSRKRIPTQGFLLLRVTPPLLVLYSSGSISITKIGLAALPAHGTSRQRATAVHRAASIFIHSSIWQMDTAMTSCTGIQTEMKHFPSDPSASPRSRLPTDTVASQS